MSEEKHKEQAAIYFSEDGKLSKVFDGYNVREEQLEFSERIHEAINKKRSMIGEANTGVGKSLAALTGAATIIEETGRPVVIVTSSILLQEQYMDKDIPILEKAMGRSYGPVLAKGKGNYICLEKALSSKAMDVQPQFLKQAEELKKFAATSKTGDLNELDFEPSYPVRQNFTITQENECKGKRCSMYRDCFYYQNQNKIPSSKIVVCNYHYFFLGLEIPNMLPSDIGAVIFDEFHEVVSIGRDILEINSRQNDFNTMNTMLVNTQKSIEQKDPTVDLRFGEYIDLGEFMHSKEQFHYRLTEWFVQNRGTSERIVINENMEGAKLLMQEYATRLQTLEDDINHWKDNIAGISEERLFNDGYAEEVAEWYTATSKYLDFVSKKRFEMDSIVEANPEEHKRLVWLEMGDKDQYVKLVSKPFDVQKLLKPIFTTTSTRHPKLENSISIGMSATLTVARRFDHFKGLAGLEKEDLVECIVNSPFDMENNMLWYLPPNCPEGNQPGHDVFVLNEMEKFIDELNGKVMCLFTSVFQMNNAARHLTKMFKGRDIQIIKQGDLPKRLIVEKMRSEDNVVIVGTRSFFTGVDIQGSNLSAVLIDKIPFPMIGDPINEYLMSEDRGFFKYSLPDSIITLKQGFGRLIRTEEDKGVVSLLDGRLRTKNYKNRIFNSFNFKTKGTTSFEDCIKFMKE